MCCRSFPDTIHQSRLTSYLNTKNSTILLFCNINLSLIILKIEPTWEPTNYCSILFRSIHKYPSVSPIFDPPATETPSLPDTNVPSLRIIVLQFSSPCHRFLPNVSTYFINDFCCSSKPSHEDPNYLKSLVIPISNHDYIHHFSEFSLPLQCSVIVFISIGNVPNFALTEITILIYIRITQFCTRFQ